MRSRLITVLLGGLLLLGCSDPGGRGGERSGEVVDGEDSTKTTSSNISGESQAHSQSSGATETEGLTEGQPLPPTHIKVYVENSASMDGYVKGNSKFEAAITDLLVRMNFQYPDHPMEFHFVNSQIHEAPLEDLQDFIGVLEPTNSIYRTGNRGTTNLNDIIKNILGEIGPTDIGVFVSDCIYSIKNEDTGGQLAYERSLTMDAFLDKLKELSVSVVIIRLESEFNGIYYDKEDNGTTLTGEIRPYFVWLIGPPSHINRLQKRIEFDRLDGYNDQLIVALADPTAQTRYTILPSFGKKGRFSVDRDGRTSENLVHSIEDIRLSDRGPSEGAFGFAVAVDYSQVPLDEKFLTDPTSYRVNAPFRITSIESIDALRLGNQELAGFQYTNFTHVIQLETSDILSIDELNIELLNRMPDWVENFHAQDDSDVDLVVAQKTTFGLRYLIEGVANAYQEFQGTSDKALVNMEIIINR